MNTLWDEFNPKQLQAITSPLGHMIINAAAGTGKTSTLAARIIYMQTELSIPPSSILGISFSRTARTHLLDKLSEFCKKLKSGSPVKVYTFHGLAYRIVRMAIGYEETYLKPRFDVLDTEIDGNRLFLSYAKALLDGTDKKLDKENAAVAFLKVINELRQGSDDLEPILAPEDLDQDYAIEVDIGLNMNITVTSKDVITVWKRYEKLLKQHNAVDYNGLICEAIRILSIEGSETSKRVNETLQAIVVDEFQDTSRAQNALLFSLAGPNIPINVVGDTDQTIYTFNGSSVRNMENFTMDALNTNVEVNSPIYMVENYRSSPTILEVANHIRKISTKERLLISASTTKDIIASDFTSFPVRLIHAPRLELAAEYIANEIDRLLRADKLKENEIAILIRKNSVFAPQGNKVIDKLKELGFNVDSYAQQADMFLKDKLMFVYDYCQDPDNYGSLLSEIIEHGPEIKLPDYLSFEQFLSYLKEASDAGATYCYEAVDMLYDQMNGADESATPTGIQVRTVHSAKGQEYRAVFLMYLGDRSFPHGSRPDIEEERRLLYVGITRARERLYILGKPGIHQEDFFGSCKSSSTIMEQYLVANSNSESIEWTFMENDSVTLVEQAREKQLNEQALERKKLWQSFDEE